jgi:hypothetical protein
LAKSNGEHWFSKIATDTANSSGRPWAFGLAARFVAGWLITGPAFHFSDTWQLVMNTREIECQFHERDTSPSGARGQVIQPSKALLPALVESHLPVWESRRFSRQLYDRLALLGAISKNLQEKAFIAFLHYFDLDWILWHRNRTGIAGDGLDHNEIYTAFFKGPLRQTIPRHLLNIVPVLAQITGSLLLGWKSGLEAASLAGISVCNLEKDRLITLLNFPISRQTVAHRLFLRETLARYVGKARP